jgi:hypothetical protein
MFQDVEFPSVASHMQYFDAQFLLHEAFGINHVRINNYKYRQKVFTWRSNGYNCN